MATDFRDTRWRTALLDALGFAGQKVRQITLKAGIGQLTTATVDIAVDGERIERFVRRFKERVEPLDDTPRPREHGYYWVRSNVAGAQLEVACWLRGEWLVYGSEWPRCDENMAFIGERLQEPETPAVTA